MANRTAIIPTISYTHTSHPDQTSPSSPISPTFTIRRHQVLPIQSRKACFSQKSQQQQCITFGGSTNVSHDQQSMTASTLVSPGSSIVKDSVDSANQMSTNNPWHTEPTDTRPTPKAKQSSSDTVKTKSPKLRKWRFSASASSKSDYGGFCKGAWNLQTGIQGMVLRNQSAAMTGQSQYWACCSSKCSFEGGAIKKSKEWSFDDSICEAYGVRYRWKFLAKSHVVPPPRVIDRNYDYQCILCSAQGMEPAKVRGENAFIEHVSQHRGDKRNPFGMHFIVAEFGRVALEEESWDVNLLPLVTEELEDDTAELEGSSPGLGITIDAGVHTDRQNQRATSDSLSLSSSSAHSTEAKYVREGGRNSEAYSPLDDAGSSIHPTLRGNISIPDPWRASYVTMEGESLG